jgi:hydroxyacylglutathione hydrolase
MHIETIVVGEFQVNCGIVWRDASQAIVIDPGSDPDAILALVRRERLTVCAYMLTHGHVDHISALADLCDAMPAPIGMHASDLSWAFSEANGMLPFYPPPRRPAEIARHLIDGQVWQDGGIECRVIATPGHTPGSVCLFFPADNVLFSGDTLFAGSVGRTDLPGGDARRLSKSLGRIAELPDHVSIYPGHGPVTDLAKEKRTNFFMRG